MSQAREGVDIVKKVILVIFCLIHSRVDSQLATKNPKFPIIEIKIPLLVKTEMLPCTVTTQNKIKMK